ncbi:dihydrofolate reductase family protein [Sphaerisporangium sp. TRM90804]|uniref:dihydrofolate reductase family protein n=1 Tax=Sphaerisporangium sp. TRM90804 TaxID=3031113 RepID=UPI0024474877|nr:dihydrofolate reductase family protein [Sphaerisporangium sp. TRM90804]MDH2428235.1 dihydrofolate reductase family protein [Sphaerisporangium sp. TRM90804]
MRKVIVSLFATLDGFATGPNGDMGWVTDRFREDTEKYAHHQLFGADQLVVGRVTYEIMAGSWPSMTDDSGSADRMNSLPKLVFSRTLEEPLSWNNATLAKGDLAEEVTRLKHEPGDDILVYGSVSISRQLMKLGLVDRFRLWVHPVALGGSGADPIFADYDTTELALVDTTILSSGVVILDYERPGGTTR